MTLDQFKTEIAWEAKLQGDTVALARLDSIILDAAIFMGQSHPELLLVVKTDYALDLGNPTPYVAALGVERVEVQSGEDFEEAVTIPEEGNIVGPAAFPFWPKCYHIEGNAATAAASPKGIRVVLTPPLVGGSEVFSVYWKMVPILTNGSHIIPDSWIVYLKKEVLARVAFHRAKGELDDGKAYVAGAQQALQAEVGTDKNSTAASN